jgi:hypothetical protein
VQPQWELSSAVIWKPVELGHGSVQRAGILVGCGMWLSPAKLVPGPEGWRSWQGVVLFVPHGAGGQQSLRGRGPEGRRVLAECGSAAAQEAGVPAGLDLVWR